MGFLLHEPTMSHLYDDPRWVALHSGQSPCPACGDVHRGLFDLVCDTPDAWVSAGAGGQEAGVLGDEYCTVAGGSYLRADLHIPLHGAPGMSLTLGLWAAVSPTDYDRHMAWREAAARLSLPKPFFGWLANRVPGYDDTLNVACRLQPRGGLAPYIVMLESHHPLTVEQQRGIPFGRVLDLYALNGHDMRAELLAPEFDEAPELPDIAVDLAPPIDGYATESERGKSRPLAHAVQAISRATMRKRLGF